MTTANISTMAKSATAFITICFSLMNVWANAQNPVKMKQKITVPDNQQAVSRLIRYQVKQPYLAQARKILSDYVMQSLADEDNIMSEAYYEQEDSTVLWLIERCTGKEAIKKADNMPQAKALASFMKKALVKPATIIYVKDLAPVSRQAWRRAAKKEDEPLTIMLFVDARPGTQDDFKSIYSKALPEFRSEPGVVTYQLSQLEADSTQFVTYEKFRSKAAFQYHLDFPPILPVIGYLNTNIKAPPFQRGLHTLIEFAPLTRE